MSTSPDETRCFSAVGSDSDIIEPKRRNPSQAFNHDQDHLYLDGLQVELGTRTKTFLLAGLHTGTLTDPYVAPRHLVCRPPHDYSVWSTGKQRELTRQIGKLLQIEPGCFHV